MSDTVRGAMRLDLSAVQEAAERIGPHVHRTPVITSRLLDERVGCRVFLKCENLQKVGAFKARGASNAVFSLSDADAAGGVATHSSGNHGAALAYAAAKRGIPAHVVMPKGAPAVKRRAVESYGAHIIDCDNTLAAREETLAAVVQRTSALEIHPYENPYVIAGQGTVALELLEQAPGLDCILAPVGGGGLLSGIALAAPSGVVVVGAEPATVNDAALGLAAGERAPAPSAHTIADGLRTRLGASAFEILSRRSVQVETVSEAEIIAAMRFVWERTKLLIEPSSAVPIAVLMTRRLPHESVGVVLTGGNVDLDALPFSDSVRS